MTAHRTPLLRAGNRQHGEEEEVQPDADIDLVFDANTGVAVN